MVIFYLLTIFAALPIIAYVLAQKTSHKGLIFGSTIIILTICLVVFISKFAFIGSVQKQVLSNKIFDQIYIDERISPEYLNEINSILSEQELKNWLINLSGKSIDLNKLNSAESLITFSERFFNSNEEKLIFYGIYTTLRDAKFPEFKDSRLVIDSNSSIPCLIDSGIINLNITELYVNKNSIYWVMPVSVGEGTTTIILNDGGNDSIINNTNGPSGLIYATVTIPRHFTANSVTAWSLTAIDPCYYRQSNGIGAITSFTTLGGAFLPIGTFVNASVPNGTTHNPEDLLMQFTLSNEDFIQGDIFTIDFYTSSSFGTGFLNATNYPNGITNWNLNPIPQAGQEYNPGTTIPTLLLIKMDISNPNNPGLTYNDNYFSG